MFKKISISIAEILPENLYLDEVSWILIPHKKNTEILLDREWKIQINTHNLIHLDKTYGI